MVRNTRIGKRPITLMRGQKLNHRMRISRRTLKAGLRTHKSRNRNRGNRDPDQCAPVADWFHPCLILCHRIGLGTSMTCGRAAPKTELSGQQDNGRRNERDDANDIKAIHKGQHLRLRLKLMVCPRISCTQGIGV